MPSYKSITKRFVSLALAAAAPLTFGVLPANAVVAAPATVFTYDSEATGQNGWGNVLGYASAGDFSEWGNFVNDQPAGGSGVGSIAVKSHMGNGAVSNTAVGSIAASDSLIGAGTMVASISFWAPQAGKVVSMGLTDSNYGNGIAVDATTTTVVGWQKLYFDFTTPTTGTYSASIAYSKANLDYDPASLVVSQDFYFDNASFNGAANYPLVPSTVFNYESNTVGQNGWSNVLGYTSLNDGSAWGNYVSDHPAGGSSGTKAVKAHMGGGTSNISVGSIADGSSLISNADKTVTMNFWSPAAGKSVALAVTDNNYGNAVLKTATATAQGWQVLTFDFATPTSGTFNSEISYNRANMVYDFGNTGVSADFYFDDVAFNGASSAALASVVSGPAVANIRLKSVSTAGAFLTPAAWGWAPGHCCNQPATDTVYLKYLTYGTSYTLAYNITGANNTPLANTPVTVTIAGAATWTVGGVAKVAGDTLTGTTDAQGDVSFTLVNTNTSAQAESGRRDLGSWSDNSSGNPDVVGDLKVSVGATTENRDTMWLHVTQEPIAPGNYGSNIDKDNKGNYVHVRLDKSILNSSFDASWWDGIREYRDADTRAYVKFVPVRSTFSLTYVVTDENHQPMANQPVSLIVNANYSCSKATFKYGSLAIPRDNCAGGGETVLPAKKTDGTGRVTFVLTNTNVKGEATPTNLNAPPTVGVANEIGTNIKPHVADKEAVDMLLAHFVEPSASSLVVSAPQAAKLPAYSKKALTFTVKDSKGSPVVGANVKFVTNGVGAVSPFGVTDKAGQVTAWASNTERNAGTQAVAAIVDGAGELTPSSVVELTWAAPKATATVFGDRKAILVHVTDAKGKIVKMTIPGIGKITRRMASADEHFEFASSVGSKIVTLVLDGKTIKTTVKVTK
jgi:hypothetical protein